MTAVFSALRISTSSADDRDHAVDDEPRLGQQLGDQRAAVVLLVAVRGAIVDDDDQCPPHQLRGCSMGATVYPAPTGRSQLVASGCSPHYADH